MFYVVILALLFLGFVYAPLLQLREYLQIFKGGHARQRLSQCFFQPPRQHAMLMPVADTDKLLHGRLSTLLRGPIVNGTDFV